MINEEKKKIRFNNVKKELSMPDERYKMMHGVRAFMAGHGLQCPEYVGRTWRKR